MLAEYTTRNSQALAQVASKGDVQILPYPEDVLKKLNELSEQVVKEESEKDEMSKNVYASYKAYRDQVMKWHDISERAFLNARSLK